MKKQFVAIVLSIAACLGALAAKPTVYVQEFDNTARVKNGWIETVRGAVVEGFYNSNRMNLVDAVTEQARYEEELRRMKDNLASDDLETAEALKTRGAHVLLHGDVTSVAVPGTRLSSGTMSYDATVTFTLRVVNAIDGTLIGSKVFTLPKSVMGFSVSGLKGVYETEDAAVQAIKGDITKAMKGFVEESFPLTGSVEDIEKLSKNGKEVEILYAGLGSEDGLIKGTKLDVKLEQKIGKRTIQKLIGEVEVEEVVGDDISLCKVKKGGLEIKNALDQGQTVLVTSKSKKK